MGYTSRATTDRELSIRRLGAPDAPALERFLGLHRDSSVFLRSNARRGGLEYQGGSEQGTYVAAFDGGQVVGVASHAWNGVILVQATDLVERLVPACVEESGRVVQGFSGPLEQVRRARSVLHLDAAPTKLDEAEGLYGLDLADLVLPSPSPRLQCRNPTPAERDTLVAWRVAYGVEVLGDDDSDGTHERVRRFVDMLMGRGDLHVALYDGAVVSLSGFNSGVESIVQLGGIYTPPELRRRGYARAAVAASLIAARDRGASRAVLFTSNPSAIRCYASLGFRKVGDYGLILLK